MSKKHGSQDRPGRDGTAKPSRIPWVLGGSGIVLLAVVLVAGLLQTRESEAIEITVYKSPTCGCCNKWIDHLEDNGFRVNAVNRPDMHQVKAQLGVNENVASCHTAVAGDYLVEGNMPAWRGKLSDEDALLVIAWFQSLWPEEFYSTWAEIDQRSRSER